MKPIGATPDASGVPCSLRKAFPIPFPTSRLETGKRTAPFPVWPPLEALPLFTPHEGWLIRTGNSGVSPWHGRTARNLQAGPHLSSRCC